MQIKSQQFEALKEPQQQRYIQHVSERLAAHFPEPVAALGPVRLRQLIDHGLQRAADHGLDSGSDTYRYLCLMVCFGPDFDRDPALPWAANILGSRILGGPTQKIQRLFDTGMACYTASGQPHVPRPAPVLTQPPAAAGG